LTWRSSLLCHCTFKEGFAPIVALDMVQLSLLCHCTFKEGFATIVALDMAQLGPTLDLLEYVRVLQLLLTLVHKLESHKQNKFITTICTVIIRGESFSCPPFVLVCALISSKKSNISRFFLFFMLLKMLLWLWEQSAVMGTHLLDRYIITVTPLHDF
jgi:hypothetical protein